jgi:hypothetical protein
VIFDPHEVTVIPFLKTSEPGGELSPSANANPDDALNEAASDPDPTQWPDS